MEPRARNREPWDVKVGDPAPANFGEMTHAGIDSRTPFEITFAMGDAGKKAHYLLRWVNQRSQPGPWSELHSATITGV